METSCLGGGGRRELQELRQQLRSSSKEQQRAAVKAVVEMMGSGKEVSFLFPEMLSCLQSSSIEIKKMIYLFLANSSKRQPHLAVLAVNSFRKDTAHPNPLIRALALRTMAYIRLEAVAEHISEPLTRCCTDPDPYVRKTAAVAIAKLYDVRPDMVHGQPLLQLLLNMFLDSNPLVVSNAVAALGEISRASGRCHFKSLFAKDSSCVSRLLSALNECTEWGQVFILDALVAYDPPTPKAAEAVIERVLPRLSHANPAVILSAVKVILKLLDK